MSYTGFVIGDSMLGFSGDTHPLWCAAYAVADPYWVLGTSAVGHSHLLNAKSRDDAFVVRSAGPWLAVGVADGVGQYSHSRYGATYVADTLASQLLRPLVPPPIQNNVPRAENQKKHWKPFVQALPKEANQQVSTSKPLSQAGSLTWRITQEQNTPSLDHPDHPLPPLDVVIKKAFQRTHQRLLDYARYLTRKPHELSCTALALLLNTETGEGVVGQVGDGALLGLRSDGTVDFLLDVAGDDNLQSTHVITSSRWEKHFVMSPLPQDVSDNPFNAFFVMTDGVSVDLLYSPIEEMHNWGKKVKKNIEIFTTPEQAAVSLLHSLANYEIQGNYDDRTLVIIARKDQTYANSNRDSK